MNLPKIPNLWEVREGEGHRQGGGGPFLCVGRSRRVMIDREACWQYNPLLRPGGRCGSRTRCRPMRVKWESSDHRGARGS